MSRWFRHYAGMMRDEKLVSVAVKSKQPVERVVWVWGALLESASEINENGVFDFDAAEAAYFLRADEADILSILASLEEMGRIHGCRVVKWSDRQFQSDTAAERQKRYRDRRKEQGDGLHVTRSDVTPPSRDGIVTPQETETETETQTDQQQQAQHPTASRGRAELDALDASLRKAAGLEQSSAPGLISLAPVIGLLDAGHDLELDVLPTVRMLAARAKRPPSTWDYFTEAIREASARRRGVAGSGLAPPIASTAKPMTTAEVLMARGRAKRDGEPRGNDRADAGQLPRLGYAG